MSPRRRRAAHARIAVRKVHAIATHDLTKLVIVVAGLWGEHNLQAQKSVEQTGAAEARWSVIAGSLASRLGDDEVEIKQLKRAVGIEKLKDARLSGSEKAGIMASVRGFFDKLFGRRR